MQEDHEHRRIFTTRRIVNETDPVFASVIKEIRKDTHVLPFGSDILEEYDANEKKKGRVKTNQQEKIIETAVRCEKIMREKLQSLLLEKNNFALAKKEERVFLDHVTKMLFPRDSFAELVVNISTGTLTAKEMADIFRLRKIWLEQENEKWQKIFEGMREDYLSTIQTDVLLLEAQRIGLLPSFEAVANKLRAIPIYIQDPINNDQFGDYYVGGIQILTQGIAQKIIQSTLFHELNHAMSGSVHIEKRRERSRTYGDNISMSIKEKYAIKKIGLVFYPAKHPDAALSWLNEGVTELLARKFAARKFGRVPEITSYIYEQEAIIELVNSGIDFQLFVNAWLESMYEDKKHEGFPHFRILAKAIHARKGRGWLKRIQENIDARYMQEHSAA